MTAQTGTFGSEQSRIPWWVILLTGIAAVILGILLLTNPATTTVALVQFLGIFWFVSGIFSIVEIFIDSRSWGWKLALGVIGILAGISIVRHPLTSAILIPSLVVIIVAIEGIIYGVVSVVRAFTEHSLGMGILGVLSVVFGLILLFSPALAALGLPLLVGILAIVGGGAAIFSAFRVRGEERMPAPGRQVITDQIPVTGPEDETNTHTEEESDRKE